MRPWGVRVALSVALASPEKLGGLKTADPLDPAVKAWWAAKADEIYKLIPDFAGFTVKADSEGEVGPSSYGRSPADAANLLAGALAPHGGVVLYRAFVYNNHLDWRDKKADRARAAYDIFHPLDGKFLRNVIVQTKEGPDRLPSAGAGIAAVCGAAQDQPGNGTAGDAGVPGPAEAPCLHCADVEAGSGFRFARGESGNAGEGDCGRQKLSSSARRHGGRGVRGQDWLGSPLAMANLYAFGRLAWDPNLTPEQIADEWIRQTIGTDPVVVTDGGEDADAVLAGV